MTHHRSAQARPRQNLPVSPAKQRPLQSAIAAWVENLEDRTLFSHISDDNNFANRAPATNVPPTISADQIGTAGNVAASDSTFSDKVQVTWIAAANADQY